MKMTRYFCCSLLLVTVGFAQATEIKSAAEPMTPEAEKGKELYEKECVGCHGIELYTREDRNVKDYQGLKTQIQTCATNLSKPWFEEEIAHVAAYLNEYYKFEPEKAK